LELPVVVLEQNVRNDQPLNLQVPNLHSKLFVSLNCSSGLCFLWFLFGVYNYFASTFILVKVTYRIYNFCSLRFDLWSGLCVPFIACRMENRNGHVKKEHNVGKLNT